MGLTSSREPTPSTTLHSPSLHSHHNDGGSSGGGSGTNGSPLSMFVTPPTKGNLYKPQQQNHHVRQASVRSRAAQPMPEHTELDKRFAKVLVSLQSQIHLTI